MKQHGMPPIGDSLTEVIQLCFADEYRELHYFALELAEKSAKKQAPEWIDVLERLILTQSWWDTVDWIAKLVGIHFKKYPELTQPVTARWMDSGALWLQRVCLIFQLHYKAQTDAELLFRYVARVADSKEFFLQKGAGWALRQYSRTNPEAVRAFVASHSLAALTRREALRLMDNP
jgi:3-methyladenine DNA glycosylase AlkD